MNRALVFLLCLILSSCSQRWVEPPAPKEEGAFLVHVVRAPDESLPKILTWYTGTTLSQQIIIKYNPFLGERDVKVGDRILIPVEVVANDNPYGSAPEKQAAPNLLMGETTPNLLMEGKSPPAQKPKPAAPVKDLPAANLETFNDDTNPDAPHVDSGTPQPPQGAPQPPQGDRVQQLQKEIADKQKELESLQAPSVPQPGDEDMPPPGLLREYEGS